MITCHLLDYYCDCIMFVVTEQYKVLLSFIYITYCLLQLMLTPSLT